MKGISLIPCLSHGSQASFDMRTEASIAMEDGVVVGRRALFRAAYLGCDATAGHRRCPHCQELRRHKPTVSREFLRFLGNGESLFNGDNNERRLFVNDSVVRVDDSATRLIDGKWRRIISPARLGHGDRITILLHFDAEKNNRVALEFKVWDCKHRSIDDPASRPTPSPKPSTTPPSRAVIPEQRFLSLTTDIKENVLQIDHDKRTKMPPPERLERVRVRQKEPSEEGPSEPSNSPMAEQTEASLVSENDGDRSSSETNTENNVAAVTSSSRSTIESPRVSSGGGPSGTPTQSQITPKSTTSDSTPVKTGSSERFDLIIKKTPEFLSSLAERVEQAQRRKRSIDDEWNNIGLTSEMESQASCGSIEVVRVVKPPRVCRKLVDKNDIRLVIPSRDGVKLAVHEVGIPDEASAMARIVLKRRRTTGKELEQGGKVKDSREHQRLSSCENRERRTGYRIFSPPEGVPSSENEESTEAWQKKIRVYFVRSKDLAEKRLSIFARLVERKHGQHVVSSWKDATHMVVHSGVSALHVSCELGLKGARQLRRALDRLGIFVVTQRWIVDQKELRERPTIHQLWSGLIHGSAPARRAGSSTAVSIRNSNAGSRENSQETKPRSSDEVTNPCNERLSRLFLNLAKAYRKAPLDTMSEIKSRQFHILAGRVRLLDFEITGEEHQLRSLSSIKQFGRSSIDIVREFFREKGKCERLDQFERGERKAMRDFMYIWGVGRRKALDMIRVHGLRTIEDVRTAVKHKKIELTPNQRIGLDCYEDFGQKMTRQEVEAIAAIIENTLKKKFPEVTLTVMGSYRRGKTEMGDVDVVILSRDFESSTPKGAVGELVSMLMERGHIAHHLSHNIDGIRYSDRPLGSCSQQSNDSQDLTSASALSADRYDGTQTYMGVFNSPMVHGKRRRLDIKWYPYNERAYATVHFTGCGFFNRSIRLYADKVKGLKLSDHGLFYQSNPKQRYERPCETEEDLFEALGLEYKKPHERKNFDDVVDRATGVSVYLSRPELVDATIKESLL